MAIAAPAGVPKGDADAPVIQRPKTTRAAIVKDVERIRPLWSMSGQEVRREEADIALPQGDEMNALPVYPYQFRELVERMGEGKTLAAAEARMMLVDLGQRSEPYLLEGLEHERGDVRAGAILALGEMGAKQAVPHAERMLRDPHYRVRLNAMRALGLLHAYTTESINRLYESLFYEKDGKPAEVSDEVRAACADALARIQSEAVNSQLRVDVQNEENLEVRANALQALLSVEKDAGHAYKPLFHRGTEAVALSEIQRSLTEGENATRASREAAVADWNRRQRDRSRELAEAQRGAEVDALEHGVAARRASSNAGAAPETARPRGEARAGPRRAGAPSAPAGRGATATAPAPRRSAGWGSGG
ncbi:MAG: HEAT repeat domain-containing protein [Planctomycetes bacterium]|nr:HEAT repeat domain-containing protein [Planctomycetota bacterium]